MYTPRELEGYLKLNRLEFEPIRKQAEVCVKERFGNQVYVRGLIEFSSYCRCSCHYCGLRKENKRLKRFRLEKDDILQCIRAGYDEGYRSFVLQSGEDPYYTTKYLEELICEAKKMGDIALTLSIGERYNKDYERFKACGVDRFLIKHECADVKLYNRMHPHSSFKRRLQCLVDLKKLGYQIGSGFMIGLPDQTTKTIAKDLWLLKKLQVHMAGIGPFISHPDTVYKDQVSGDALMTLKAVALARVLLPESMLPITTSLGVIDPKMKEICLNYGANVVMQKLEPSYLRALYELYPKEVIDQMSLKEEKLQIEEWIRSAGKEPVFERGDHIAFR